MKNNTLNKIVIFTVGAAIGSAVTYVFLSDKYSKREKAAVESVIETFGKSRETVEPALEMNTDESSLDTATVNRYEEMVAKLKENSYVSIEEEENELDRPYVIMPEEFGEYEDYQSISLTYYANGVLTDDRGNIVEDVDGLVGENFHKHFGEYEADSVFVRNDSLQCDYEILRDYSAYHSRQTEE